MSDPGLHRSSTPTAGTEIARAVRQRCLNAACAAEYPVDRVLTGCPACGELLDVVYDFAMPDLRWGIPSFGELLSRAAMRSVRQRPMDLSKPPAGGDEDGGGGGGVWSFRELLPFYRADPLGRADEVIVTVGEGRTLLQRADRLGEQAGFTPGRLFLQYEGFNPSGSFKDNGMTAGFTHARMVGAKAVACASTGNTSASLGLYASHSGMKAFVFIGEGKIAMGKLSQALDYGATTLQIAGDFDACLARVREIAEDPANGVYLLNSVNPFRLEGQKTIMFRVLRDLLFEHGAALPDWIVVPGGNLGNCSAFAKAFIELRALGLISRLPRLAVINAAGARTLDRIYNELGVRWQPAADPLLDSWSGGGRGGDGDSLLGTYDRGAVSAEYARMDAAGERARTVASAIEINRPVNLPKALRALHAMNGVVLSVDDATILAYKAMVGRYGYGCEPASAASVAGACELRARGVIGPDQTVVCILTGHQLKDPDATVGYHTKGGTPTAGVAPANAPIRVRDDLGAIKRAMGLA